LLRRLAPLATVLIAVSMVAPSSAYASPVVAAVWVEGGGNISPGFPIPPSCAFQTSFTFSGAITGAVSIDGTDNPALVVSGNVAFVASSSICESAVLGQGSGTATGSGSVPLGVISSPSYTGPVSGSFALSCPISYSRVGSVVTIGGSCTVSAVLTGIGGQTFTPSATGLVAGAFTFQPTSVNPATSYLIEGMATLVNL
jgi:hypothetical protein